MAPECARIPARILNNERIVLPITDHGVVQSFPEAYHLVGDDNPDIKVIYGVEAYLAPDNTKSIYNGKGQSIDTTYCVLEVEL